MYIPRPWDFSSAIKQVYFAPKSVFGRGLELPKSRKPRKKKKVVHLYRSTRPICILGEACRKLLRQNSRKKKKEKARLYRSKRLEPFARATTRRQTLEHAAITMLSPQHYHQARRAKNRVSGGLWHKYLRELSCIDRTTESN